MKFDQNYQSKQKYHITLKEQTLLGPALFSVPTKRIGDDLCIQKDKNKKNKTKTFL